MHTLRAQTAVTLPALLASALLAAAHAAPAQAPARAQAQASAICRPDATQGAPRLPAVLPIEVRNNHVHVQVCYGERPLWFVLDTGAGTSIFDLDLAKSLDVPLGAQFRASGGGPATVPAAQVTGASVIIPGARVVVPVRQAISFATISANAARPMDGILGADFIARYIVAVDYRNAQLRLYDRATFRYEGAGTTVPVTLAPNGFVYVRGEIGLSDGARVSGTFVVDVGSSLALALTKPFVERNRLRDRVGATVRRPSGRGVGGVAVAEVGRVETLRIGGVELTRPVTYMFGDSSGVFAGSAWDGNVGSDILRRFTVYFDYAARTMTLEPHEGTNEPFEADMSGAQFTAMGAAPSLSVEFVLDGSPAWNAGLRRGDIVVAIDGRAAGGDLLDDLRRRLKREGETVELRARRGDQEIVVRFTTRRIV